MKYSKYLWSFLSMAIAYLGIIYDGWISYVLLIYAFVFIPVLELFLEGSRENLTSEQEKNAEKDVLFDLMIWAVVPLQVSLVILFCISLQRELSWFEYVGKIITLGLSCGVYGINVAHELGHRITKHEQIMAKTLLLTSQYMHFFIEHNRGHHKNVSTDEDPASSRLGEPIYTFWVRSVYGSFVSAWQLEHFRLKKVGKPFFSIFNEMIWYQVIQLTSLLAILYFFNWQTMLSFMGAATIGILLLETVNYIEHYGLQRHKGEFGFHKVLPIHSWNSNHPIGRGILFDLSRHSDHHFRANRKYQILKYHENSPQMPTGYPGMMVLSLFPPLWFKVMNPLVKDLRMQYEERLA